MFQVISYWLYRETASHHYPFNWDFLFSTVAEDTMSFARKAHGVKTVRYNSHLRYCIVDK
jgi:hypothetical protein